MIIGIYKKKGGRYVRVSKKLTYYTTSKLRNMPVYLMVGKYDKVVKPHQTKELCSWFRNHSANLICDVKPYGHAYPTKLPTTGQYYRFYKKGRCDGRGGGYNCGFDTAGTYFKHIYGRDKIVPMNYNWEKNGALMVLDVRDFVGNRRVSLVLDKWYLYVPHVCRNGRECRFHIHWHGCGMTVGRLG